MLTKITSQITKVRLVKGAIAVMVCAAIAGGASLAWDYVEATREQEARAAQAQIVMAQAQQRGQNLLSMEEAKAAAAAAIGQDASALTFTEVELKDGWMPKQDKEHREHYDRRAAQPLGLSQQGAPPTATTAPAPSQPTAAQPAPAPATPTPNPATAPDGTKPVAATPQAAPAPMPPMPRPVYKIECYAGNLEYDLVLDAQDGTVLRSKVETDDDLFHFGQ